MFEAIENQLRDNAFLLELLVAYIPFVITLRRRKFFWPRFLLCIAACCCLSFLTPQFLFEFMAVDTDLLSAVSLVYAMARYLVIFLCTVAALFVCFDCRFAGGVFCATAAYATQHAFYQCTTIYAYIFAYYAPPPAWVPYVCYWLMMLVVYGAVYLLFGRRLLRNDEYKFNNVKLIVTSFVLVVLTVVLSFLGHINTYYNWFLASTPVYIIMTVSFVIICFLVLANLFDNANNKKMERENDMIRYLWQRDRSQYMISKQNMEQLNVKYHDLKYQLNALAMDDEARKELDECLKNYAGIVKTGCDTLDVVLTEKKVTCDKLGIALTCMADGSCLGGMNPVDIYSLFGNAIDNAVECLGQVTDAEKKIINVFVQRIENMYYIRVENYLPVKPTMIEGMPRTSKADAENHGFGLKSIRMIAEKQGGDIYITTDNEIFSLTVLFPLKKDR